MKYKVNEIFHSVQGEGVHSGRLMTFIRLSGCNVKCNIRKFCDTEYSSFELMDEQEILNQVKYKDVCVTGGEPLENDLFPLFKILRENHHRVHVQTSGTIDMDLETYALTNHVVVSPKLPVDKLKLFRCDEIKVVYCGQDVESYFGYGGAVSHFIQPLEKNGEFNYDETIKKLNDISEKWRLNLQMHKILNIK